MSQTISTERIISETYSDKGIVRFKQSEKTDHRWWICLSDMAAFFPTTNGEPFSLEKWFNLKPDAISALDQYLDRTGEEIWGVYSIAVELSRVPKVPEFADFPLWIATRGRRPIE